MDDTSGGNSYKTFQRYGDDSEVIVQPKKGMLNLIYVILPGRGGGYMTCAWTGVCHPVFRKLTSSNFRN